MSENIENEKKIHEANTVEARIFALIGNTDKSIKEINKNIGSINTDVAVLKTKFEDYVCSMGDKINVQEKRIDKIETKIEGLKEWTVYASAITAGILIGIRWAWSALK